MHFVVFHIPTVDRQYVVIGAHITLLLFFSEGGSGLWQCSVETIGYAAKRQF